MHPAAWAPLRFQLRRDKSRSPQKRNDRPIKLTYRCHFLDFGYLLIQQQESRAEDFATTTTIKGIEQDSDHFLDLVNWTRVDMVKSGADKDRSTRRPREGKGHSCLGKSKPTIEKQDARRERHFLHVVEDTVKANKDKPFASWYDQKGSLATERTFGEIWDEAGVIAHHLCNEWNVEKGQRVILCYDFGLHFFASFIGCLRAGVTAVLVYPPGPPLSKSLSKLTKVVQDCDPALILTDSKISFAKNVDGLNPISKTRGMWPNIEFKVTDRLPKAFSTFDEAVKSTDLAFLQYTSGSAGDPKGVMVTFGALLSNVDLIHDGFYKCFEDDGGIPSEIVGFSRLPQYHDLGLTYAAIVPFVGGWRMHMLSPLTCIHNPLLWLELMSRHKVSWGVAPNFAFDLVTRRFIKAREKLGGKNPIPGLDLLCLQNLQNAAEPIKLATRDTFGHVFVKYGLCRNWFHAGYGLAENVVVVCWINGYHLSTPREEAKLPVVAVGSRETFHSSLVMRIVDPKTLKEVEGGVIGELWIAARSVRCCWILWTARSKQGDV
jgi:acyl-CoA synthetase (AMP-forming)/AMP-acid ligase II